jgi:hypothetical protein
MDRVRVARAIYGFKVEVVGGPVKTARSTTSRQQAEPSLLDIASINIFGPVLQGYAAWLVYNEIYPHDCDTKILSPWGSEIRSRDRLLLISWWLSCMDHKLASIGQESRFKSRNRQLSTIKAERGDASGIYRIKYGSPSRGSSNSGYQ